MGSPGTGYEGSSEDGVSFSSSDEVTEKSTGGEITISESVGDVSADEGGMRGSSIPLDDVEASRGGSVHSGEPFDEGWVEAETTGVGVLSYETRHEVSQPPLTVAEARQASVGIHSKNPRPPRQAPEIRIRRHRPPSHLPDSHEVGSPPSPPHRKGPNPSRQYPRMRALLSNPERVPGGSRPIAPYRPPPVPGTFIPRPPPPPPRPKRTELDGLLAVMADGLLIGEGEGGASEIRVTLRDEFFAGTELRISLLEGRVSAKLIPPNREVYWQLGGEAGELRLRLEERGLRVSQLEVLEPDSN